MSTLFKVGDEVVYNCVLPPLDRSKDGTDWFGVITVASDTEFTVVYTDRILIYRDTTVKYAYGTQEASFVIRDNRFDLVLI